MSNPKLVLNSNWQEKADQYLQNKNYDQAVQLYEQAIDSEPDVKSHYWHLGLILLLQGKEIEAQTTWFLAMGEEADAIDQGVQELSNILETEAERQRLIIGDYTTAWVIRQHIQEINPADINNVLHLVGLSTLNKTYTPETLVDLGIIETLKSDQTININNELLLQILNNILEQDPAHSLSYEFAEVCISHIQDSQSFMEVLIPFIYKLAYSGDQYELAIKFTEQGLTVDPEHPELLRCLSTFYQDIRNYSKGIEAAENCYALMKNFPDQVYAKFLLLRGLMSAGGRWTEFSSVLESYKLMLNRLIEEDSSALSFDTAVRLFAATFFFPYFQDQLAENIHFRRQVAQFIQSNIENYAKDTIQYCRQWQSKPLNRASEKRLKIGYVSHCLRNHSVGWLARGLFRHHDHEKFAIYTYLLAAELNQNELQKWFISKSDKSHRLGLDGQDVAKKVYEDGVDILVDLDSMTLTNVCETFAVKPAPIQVTWLGWDASEVPTIDYFIADPYVLPEDAQNYYREKIVRLPQTYIAIDGFEVAVPTLRRDQLDIPMDAIIYFTAQRGYKYHPHTAQLQLQILKEVPNSYFIIKGTADQESLQTFYAKIAESVGVDCDRLKLLPLSPTEAIHRANLTIADVVLDTYPYNGATTTMETLWREIPMVTRVGEQFAARNSYTMMINAGITEGIAWTDEEYVEWGIKLGTDENLRQQVAWKLRKNKRTAPLWDAKKFTREMENAYKQMWLNYTENGV
jgi:predicted O-linked N-acetylglucosamine transferase (SPINDLY family)